MNTKPNPHPVSVGCKGIIARAAISGSSYSPPNDSQKVAKFYFTMKNVQRKPGSTMLSTKSVNDQLLREKKYTNALESRTIYLKKAEVPNKIVTENSTFTLTTTDEANDEITPTVRSSRDEKISVTSQYCQTESICSDGRKHFAKQFADSSESSQQKIQIKFFEKELTKMRREIDSMILFRKSDDLIKLETLDSRMRELETVLQQIKSNKTSETESTVVTKINQDARISNQNVNDKSCSFERNQTEIHLNSPPSPFISADLNFECDYCRSVNHEKIVRNIRGELNSVLHYFQQDDVIVNVQLLTNDRYHVSLSDKLSGEEIICFMTDQEGIKEAHDDGVFYEYFTVFLAGEGNSPEQKQEILNRAFGLP